MWTAWKKEIIGISLAVVLGICAVVVFTVQTDRATRENTAIKGHVMAEQTVYWTAGRTLPHLPEGYEEFAKVEERISPSKTAAKNGQSNCFAAGTLLYKNPDQPGWVLAPGQDGRWELLTVSELQNGLIRYGGQLYISQSSIPYGQDVSFSYDPKDFSSTGKTLTWTGNARIPMEDGAANNSMFSGGTGEIYLDSAQPDRLLVKYAIPRKNGPATEWFLYVTLESLGLDYSAYEWTEDKT